MAIPDAQLQTWSNQGATVSAQDTHKSIRNALASYTQWPAAASYDPYLQGSYRNFTNIYGNSDVDLVVELTSVFYSNLTQAEKLLLGMKADPYTWVDFRRDVISALTAYYGSRLIDTSGSKSIKVLPDSGRLKADVVVAATYKYFENMSVRAEGITFWTQPVGDQVVNYPKLHFVNGADKNSDQRTKGWYKPTVRVYKNARNRLVENNSALKGHFPSYFVECLLCNVPDNQFGRYHQANFVDTLNWLNGALSGDGASKFVTQSGMHYLFGTSSVQWDINNARELVAQLIQLWSNW